MYLQTQGFVLKYRNWREGDRIYTIYTDKLGKTDIQARGTRKAQSKLAGHLQPFRLINFNLAHGKQRYQLIGAQAAPELRITHNELGKAYGYYFLELIDELTRAGQASPEVFNLIQETFGVLEKLARQKPRQLGGPGHPPTSAKLWRGREQYKRLRVAFLLKLLLATGFNPEKRLKRGDSIQGALEHYLHHPIAELVQEQTNGDPEKSRSNRDNGAGLKSLFNISQYALNEVVEKPLKSVKFLQKLT